MEVNLALVSNNSLLYPC